MDVRDQNNPVIKQKPLLTAVAFIQISSSHHNYKRHQKKSKLSC